MKVLSVIALVCLALQCRTQDFSMSQFQNSTALLNSAAVGDFSEQFRVTAGHKTQWGALANSFSTNLISIEGSLTKNRKDNYPSAGFIAITDKAGKSGYSAAIYRALGAYKFKLNRHKSISLGMEVGLNQRRFSLDGLAWDSQFNGAGYDPSLPTGESFSNQTISDLDVGFGAEFRNENTKKLKWKAGLGFHHYYQQRTVLENGKDHYPTLAQAYWIAEKSKGSLMWRYYALLQSQNLTGALSGSLGGEVFYRFNYDSRYTTYSTSSSLSLGALYRYHDAVTALVGFEFKRKLRVTLSYDFTVSSWNASNNFRGGPELMLTYLGSIGGAKKRKV